MLTNDEKKRFRAIGHQLKPVLQIGGKGLTEGVFEELDRALEDHELIKVKLAIMEREDRQAVVEELCRESGAQLVQSVGKTVLLHRAAKKPNPRLSNLLRG